MNEIKCLIVSDGITNVSILTLCVCLLIRSGAEGWLKLLKCSLSLLLLHFLPLAFFFFLSNLSFKLAALRHCLHLETYNSSRPSHQRKSQVIPTHLRANARKMHHYWPVASCSEDTFINCLRFQVRHYSIKLLHLATVVRSSTVLFFFSD